MPKGGRMSRRPSGRPRLTSLGDISLQALRLAEARAVTYLDIARELQLSRRHASVTVFGLAERGHLTEVERRPIAEARKPVPVYRAATAGPPGPPSAGVLAFSWPPTY
jgi:hypothetical protein